jgi:hypothetical protein
MEKRPRFEYTGQSSDEILAHVETHSVFSVLAGLQWYIQAKARAAGGEDKLTDEERVFLAVLALISEVKVLLELLAAIHADCCRFVAKD